MHLPILGHAIQHPSKEIRMLTLTTLRSVPPFAVGHVRDLRVRWALEEAGLPYQVRLIGPNEQASPAYRRQQPFGQVPVLEDGNLVIFESGAILLHLGERHPALLPANPAARAQAIMWTFAALNSVEQHVGALVQLLAFHVGEAWAAERRPALEAMAVKRLGEIDAYLAGRDYLAGPFSVADIVMTGTLRLLDRSGLIERFPTLSAYKDRCTARPAFVKALADHMAVYRKDGAAQAA
jgi:glutathione S-transferase